MPQRCCALRALLCPSLMMCWRDDVQVGIKVNVEKMIEIRKSGWGGKVLTGAELFSGGLRCAIHCLRGMSDLAILALPLSGQCRGLASRVPLSAAAGGGDGRNRVIGFLRWGKLIRAPGH